MMAWEAMTDELRSERVADDLVVSVAMSAKIFKVNDEIFASSTAPFMCVVSKPAYPPPHLSCSPLTLAC